MKLVKLEGVVSSKSDDWYRDFVEDNLKPSLKVGLVGATIGLFFGAFHGIRIGSHPLEKALGWSMLGFATATPYWAIRKPLLDKRDQGTPRDRVLASALAGFTGGGIGATICYSQGIFPYSVICAILCAGGQKAYNWQKSRVLKEVSENKVKGWLNSKWSPMTVLTDEEYKEKLQAQIDRLDAEIEFIDEQIKALKITKDDDSPPQKEEDKE